MPALYTVQVRTHPGSVREINEDSISTVLDWRADLNLDDAALNTKGHLFAVADGMGGHAAGEVASSIAIETLFREYYSSAYAGQMALAEVIAAINAALCAQAETNPQQAGMGTTLVGALLRDTVLQVFNVGDSRAYLFRNGDLAQITRDHSWVAEQISAGVLTPDEAARHPYRNVITHSLGPDRDAQPDFYEFNLAPHDVLLLCSDGLSNMASNEEMASLLRAYPLDQSAQLLLELALERGAPDNVTFALIEFLDEDRSTRRHRWPWAVLGLAIVLLLLLTLYRPFANFLFPDAMESLASPLATPTQLDRADVVLAPPASPLAVADPVRFDPIRITASLLDPQNGACGLTSGEEGESVLAYPLPSCYVFFVEGEIAAIAQSSRGWELTLAFVDRMGQPFEYVTILTEPWLSGVTPSQVGDAIALIARPISEEYAGGDIALATLAVLAASNQQNAGSLLWLADSPAASVPQTEHWTYSVFGPGGGRALRLDTPPGLMGAAIALWGSWNLPAGRNGAAHFTAMALPYEWQEAEGVYRHADN